ncbi:MAG: hypothetical protein HDS07_02300 [Bacteroides sp.]|nr:hypothetical protein [Bacteroides sp.]
MEQDITKYSLLPDIALEHNDLTLESFDEMLTEREEMLLSQINELQKQIDDSHDLLSDLMDAVKKGAIDYVDSMTDTGESFSKLKDPKSVSKLDDIEVDKRRKPADKGSQEAWRTRKMSDAKENPFDRNVGGNTNGMSEAGKAKFERYNEAYRQRLKTNTVTSNGEKNSIKTSDSAQNYESLSGLRNYRIGPVVPMPDIETMKNGYQKAVAEGKAVKPSDYIRNQNFDAFDEALKEKFGFPSKHAATKWREDNHLTIHETGDGMYLIPTDVHDSSSHSGYCSKLAEVLKGKENAQEAMHQYIRDEKIAYVKHEAKIRGVRAAKGVGLSVIKDLLKHVISNLVASFIEQKQIIQEKGLLAHIKIVLKACWEKAKVKALNILKNFGSNITGAIGSEILNAINDFFLGTFKRVFSIIRQMFGSIKSALRIICDKERPWQEKIYEAAKILSAGMVAILGFSLNEFIEKMLLSIAIPSSIASFVAECLAGLLAGILSNIVLMLFDHTKNNLKVRDANLQLSLVHSQVIFVTNMRIDVTVLKSTQDICETYNFFGDVINDIKVTRSNILDTEQRINSVNEDTNQLLRKGSRLNALKEKFENDFN